MRTFTRKHLSVAAKRESEIWIYSYSDLMTNLCALFLLMVIFLSKPHTKGQFDKDVDQYVQKKSAPEHATSQPRTLGELQAALSQELPKVAQEASLSRAGSGRGLLLTLSGALLFDLGQAELRPDALVRLAPLAKLIARMPAGFSVEVEGHADNRPITTGRFPSNWELSAARAGAVVRFLAGQGFPENSMRAIGFSSTKPIDGTGDSPENRRVVIKVSKENRGDTL